MYDARLIANYFLKLGRRDGVPVDPMKLQKLVYFAHGWYLATVGQPLLSETVEAWRWGPVIPSLYWCFNHYGGNPITEFAVARRGDSFCGDLTSISEIPTGPEGDSLREVLNEVWRVLGKFSGIHLSNLTHLKDSPWDITWSAQKGRRGVDINDEEIKRYFQRNLEDSANAAG